MTDDVSGQADGTEPTGGQQAPNESQGAAPTEGGNAGQAGQAEPGGNPPDSGESAENPTVPERYEFTMPDGVDLDQALADAAMPVFRELNLTQDQADKLTGLLADREVARADEQQAAFVQQLDDWAAELKNDPAIGGEGFEKNAGIAQSAIAQFGSEELKTLLNETGMGNHPALFKFALAVGQHLAEDQPGAGDPARQQDAIESRLYPNEANTV